MYSTNIYLQLYLTQFTYTLDYYLIPEGKHIPTYSVTKYQMLMILMLIT